MSKVITSEIIKSLNEIMSSEGSIVRIVKSESAEGHFDITLLEDKFIDSSLINLNDKFNMKLVLSISKLGGGNIRFSENGTSFWNF